MRNAGFNLLYRRIYSATVHELFRASAFSQARRLKIGDAAEHGRATSKGELLKALKRAPMALIFKKRRRGLAPVPLSKDPKPHVSDFALP
jgi:hypothetical protein